MKTVVIEFFVGLVFLVVPFIGFWGLGHLVFRLIDGAWPKRGSEGGFLAWLGFMAVALAFGIWAIGWLAFNWRKL